MRMTAYGRKQTFGLCLSRCSLMSALEEKADVQNFRVGSGFYVRFWPKANAPEQNLGKRPI